MRNSILSLFSVLLFAGCGPTPVPAYTSQQQDPVQQPIMAQTCTNPQGMVMADNYCDPNWISTQRAIAQQNHDAAMLNLLSTYLTFHYYYSSEPYQVGMYMRPGSYYTYRPSGYVIQPRTTYVTQVHNHTIIVNNGRAVSSAPSRPAPSPFSRPSYSAPSKPAPSPFSSSRSTFSSSRSSFSSSPSRRR